MRTKYLRNVKKNHLAQRQDGTHVISPAINISKLTATTTERVSASGENGMRRAPHVSSIIQKGIWKGMRIYVLTLEEKKDCPETCPLLVGCYGESMPFAKRNNTQADDFEYFLWNDLVLLQLKHPEGFVVRLHELGDFYSVDYIQFWAQALLEFPALRVFGYSHCADERADLLDRMHIMFGGREGRWNIYNSDDSKADSIRPSANVSSKEVDGFIDCPEQTKKTASCSTCGLCMAGVKNIRFIPHGNLRFADAAHPLM